MENLTNLTLFNIDSTTTVVYQTPQSVTLFVLVILSVLTLACILGNSLVILAVFMVHKLKTPCNLLIVSLAVSDWLVGLIVMPLAIVKEILGYWPFGAAACSMWTTFDVMLCTASILNLMMISIDRYLVITRPFSYSQTRTSKLMAGYMAIAWFLSILISTTPLMVGWLPVTGDNGHQCMVNQEIGYQIYATCGAFYLPLLVMIALYGKIFVISRAISKEESKNKPHIMDNDDRKDSDSSSETRRRAESMPLKENKPTTVIESQLSLPLDGNVANQTIYESEASEPTERDYLKPTDHQNNHMIVHAHQGHHGSWPLKKISVATIASVRRLLHRRKHKHNTHAIKTLGVIMGLFTACWLPFFVLALTAPICGDKCSVPPLVWGALIWLGYANSCFNPVIYARFNKEFRTPFKEILCCRCASINQAVRHDDYLHQYGDVTH